MHNFIDNAEKIHRQGQSDWAHEYFEEVFTARNKLQQAFIKSTIDLDNIESLFSAYDMASLIGRLSDLTPEKTIKLPHSLRYLTMRTLEKSILYPLNGTELIVPAPKPYGEFTDLLAALNNKKETSPISVISFNYDLCLDYALTTAGISINYGINPNEKIKKKSINYYKVHGSLNWTKDPKTNIISSNTLLPLKMKTYWDRIGLNKPAERPIDTMELIYGPEKWGHGIVPEPIIIPPTWNKGWHQDQLKSIWRAASHALATAENIFVIGYSLPTSDHFFKSFYSLSTISEIFIDKFWVFNPSSDQNIVNRFSSLMGPAISGRGKYKYHHEKFSSAIKTIGNYYDIDFDDIPD